MSAIHAVVTAAGTSSRMGGVDKLTLDLDGDPLIIRTLKAFLDFPQLGLASVAVNPERVAEFQSLFQKHLGELPGLGNSSVLIHDAARPFVTSDLFIDLLKKLETHDGVIPALPVRDTVKRVQGSTVLRTEDRETLRLVQTPQAFRLKKILELHEKAQREGFRGTDDASLVERYGGTVAWIEGPIYNLKITVPEDLAVLAHLNSQLEKKPLG